jgi:hypothetical protein
VTGCCPWPQVLLFAILDVLAKVVWSTVIFIKHPVIAAA